RGRQARVRRRSKAVRAADRLRNGEFLPAPLHHLIGRRHYAYGGRLARANKRRKTQLRAYRWRLSLGMDMPHYLLRQGLITAASYFQSKIIRDAVCSTG